MDEDLGRKILQSVKDFDELFIRLEGLIEKISDPDEKKRFRRNLGEVIAALDGEVAYPIRVALGVAENP